MEWEKLGETASLTEAYLGKIEIEREMNKVVEKLLALDNWVAPESPSGPSRSNTSGSTLPSYSRANTRDGF
ncbi:hypothetical protein M408DRAFT_97985 [Serendipita vermifera MAFF 305830]|uniref:Uncharacterized protein n=1 Tax=Serendipita vermifera MAFF 305830 TaxID=933852 RepID=A0A0C3BCK1_SERVB|nr:hypothetical protein M408DRAFT_97985 [Serendipita vermifera MAFF 305830]